MASIFQKYLTCTKRFIARRSREVERIVLHERPTRRFRTPPQAPHNDRSRFRSRRDDRRRYAQSASPRFEGCSAYGSAGFLSGPKERQYLCAKTAGRYPHRQTSLCEAFPFLSRHKRHLIDRPISLTCLVPFAPSYRLKVACTPSGTVTLTTPCPPGGSGWQRCIGTPATRTPISSRRRRSLGRCRWPGG
jgi:hypothetical protein